TRSDRDWSSDVCTSDLIPKALQAYEQVLALNPRSALAANNLAYLYSDHGGDKEKALQLAQMAKEEAPDEPQVSDTLGWILYKREIGRASCRERVRARTR